MSTLADELLQDFEDSGSEGEEQQEGELFQDEPSKLHATGNGLNGMELDGDEEAVDEDEEMEGMIEVAKDVEDEEETKAKVEKMQLGGVDDVRSVAGLMKTLEPVLQVSSTLSTHFPLETQSLHLLCYSLALTTSRLYRKLRIFSRYRRKSKQRSSAPSKIILSTIF